MRFSKNINLYDSLIILLLSVGCFGELFTPLTFQRLFAIILTPWLLINLRNYYTKIPSFINIFFAIWVVLSIFSLLWSIDKINGIKYLLYNFCSIVNFYSLFIFALKANQPLKSICVGWILLFLATLPIALWEIFSNSHLSISVQDENSSIMDSNGIKIARTFASVTYGNLNNYVLTTLYCLPFIITSFFINKGKFLSFLGIVGIIFIQLVNSSRGGLLCLGLSLIIAIFYINRYSIVNRFILFLIISVLISLIIYNASFLFNQIMGRLLENSMTSDNLRTEIYLRGIRIFLEYLTLGCGIGSLELNLEIIGHGSIAAMHNMFLEFLVQYGLVVFVLFMIFLYKIIWPLIKSKIVIFKLLGFINIVIILPMNLINSGYLTSTIFWLYWASLLIYSYKIINKNKKECYKISY